jgi:hypothetical protein
MPPAKRPNKPGHSDGQPPELITVPGRRARPQHPDQTAGTHSVCPLQAEITPDGRKTTLALQVRQEMYA